MGMGRTPSWGYVLKVVQGKSERTALFRDLRAIASSVLLVALLRNLRVRKQGENLNSLLIRPGVRPVVTQSGRSSQL